MAWLSHRVLYGFRMPFNSLGRDIREAYRSLVRDAPTTILICSVLATGIGTATVITLLLDALVFPRLPDNDARRLIYIRGASTSATYSGSLDRGRLSQIQHNS